MRALPPVLVARARLTLGDACVARVARRPRIYQRATRESGTVAHRPGGELAPSALTAVAVMTMVARAFNKKARASTPAAKAEVQKERGKLGRFRAHPVGMSVPL